MTACTALRRELTKKRLREVQPNDCPDLVVCYWANSQVQVHVAATGVLMGRTWERTGDFCTTPFGQAD
jgi:lipoate synthase